MSVESTPRTFELSAPPFSSQRPARAMISEAFPLIIVGLYSLNCLRRLVRRSPIPIATGSSTHGFPASWRTFAVRGRVSSYIGISVPTFIYVAPPAFARNSPSSGRYTIAAEPPTASWAFATKLIVTEFVIEPAIGFELFTFLTASIT